MKDVVRNVRHLGTVRNFWGKAEGGEGTGAPRDQARGGVRSRLEIQLDREGEVFTGSFSRKIEAEGLARGKRKPWLRNKTAPVTSWGAFGGVTIPRPYPEVKHILAY